MINLFFNINSRDHINLEALEPPCFPHRNPTNPNPSSGGKGDEHCHKYYLSAKTVTALLFNLSSLK
jgi:hypothetical protein